MSAGMPQEIWLNKFGVMISDYFGHVPYHVGSSLETKEWRDVDVRLIMPDKEYEQMFGNMQGFTNVKVAAITLAFATLGKEMTGLPIDFQIQSQTEANTHKGHRSALVEVGVDGVPR